MNSFFKVLGIVVLLSAFSQSSYGAAITGTVKGPDGEPFMGAFVQAQNTDTKILVSVLTDKEGRYRVPDLPVGKYNLRVRAVGYTADPHNSVRLTTDQLRYDFTLQKGVVRWSDISVYQGRILFPDERGKEAFFRFATCTACHGFETRMASVTRDEDGWRDRIQYMRQAMGFFLGNRFTDQDAADVTAYLTSLFGPDSVLPKSAADMPGYKNTVRPLSSDALNIVYVEYDLPGPSRMPWSAAPDKDGNVWMPDYGPANKIGELDPKTGEIQEYSVPDTRVAAVHSAVAAPDGTVWLTESSLKKLAKWDPKTKEITEYQDTTGKHTVRVSPDGTVWFSGGPGRFDPKTREFTHFPDAPSAYGIALDKAGNAWYAVMSQDGKIGRIDAKTSKVTTWIPPTQGRLRRIQVDADGTIWFGGWGTGKLGHFDPKTQIFKEYDLPGPEPSPYALAIDKEDFIWYSSEYQDTIGRLNPATGHVTEYPFPQSEAMNREFFTDSQGRIWFASPPNNKVGYFYLTASN